MSSPPVTTGFLPCEAADVAAMNQAVAMIRVYMRDFPELNRIIEGEESSDRMIAWAVIDTLDDYITTPPLLGSFRLAQFPSRSLLLRGAVAHLLESVAILATRNFISFSDGGTQVSFTANIPHLRDIGREMRNMYETKKMRLKVAQNLSQGFGAGVHSDYVITSTGYGSW